MQIVRFQTREFHVAIKRYVLHWTGTIKRDQRDHVFQRIGSHLAQRVAHALTFELEHAQGRAGAHQRKSFCVILRYLVDVEAGLTAANEVDGFLDDRERLQTEEVELHESGRFDPTHIELRRRHVGAWVAIERHQFLQWTVADDDARGVGRGVAVQAFQPYRRVKQRFDVRVFFGGLLESRLDLNGFGDRHGIGGVVGD